MNNSMAKCLLIAWLISMLPGKMKGYFFAKRTEAASIKFTNIQNYRGMSVSGDKIAINNGRIEALNNGIVKVNDIVIPVQKGDRIEITGNGVRVNGKEIEVIGRSGEDKRKTFNLGEFSSVNFPHYIANVELSQNAENYLVCDSNFIEDINPVVDRDMLIAQIMQQGNRKAYRAGNEGMCTILKAKFAGNKLSATGTSNVAVTDDIDAGSKNVSLSKNGTGTLLCKNVNGNNVQLNTSGTGNLAIGAIGALSVNIASAGTGKLSVDNLQAGQLHVQNKGTGQITLSGRVNQQYIHISGVTKYYASKLFSNTCKVYANGAAKAFLNVSKYIYGSVNGKSKVRYAGDAENDAKEDGLGSCKQA